MGRLFKKKKPELSQTAASQMLSNIFDACEYEANQVPMEVLVSYARYRRERYFLRWGVVVLLVLFLMLPVLFVTPEVTISEQGGAPGQPILQVEAHSWMPIDRVTAVTGGHSLPVYEMSNGVYQIIPDRNGIVTVTVVLKNQQYTQQEFLVEDVDVDPPVLVGSRRVDDNLELLFQEEDGKIDYAGIYAIDNQGQTVYPLSYDEKRCLVVFAYPSDSMNIFVSDEYGNVLQLVLTVN